MAVRIRLKKMGRKHRPFYRICATDVRSPRDGKVIEELGTYDPMIVDTDARVTLDAERVAYWLGVGAQPSETARVLIRKYGLNGTHLDAAKAARERLSLPRELPPLEPIVVPPRKQKQAEAAEAETEADGAEAASEAAAE